MSKRKITIQIPYWDYKYETSIDEVYYGNEETLVNRIKQQLKHNFEKENMNEQSCIIDKLELHIHLPEIRVEEDIPNVVYACSELTSVLCKQNMQNLYQKEYTGCIYLPKLIIDVKH